MNVRWLAVVVVTMPVPNTSHVYLVYAPDPPVTATLNCTCNGLFPDVGFAVHVACNSGCTQLAVIVGQFAVALLPSESVTVIFGLYIPEFVNTWFILFWLEFCDCPSPYI